MILPANFNNTFEPALLKEISERANLLFFKEGETIIDVGQTVRFVPLLLKGVLKISRTNDEGKDLLLYYVHANESCAMTFTCCMQQFPSEIKATAEEDVELLAIPISLMDEWLVKYPTWKSFVMRTMRNRFNELLNTLDQIAFKKTDERLLSLLRKKQELTGNSTINITHEQLANELGTAREVVSRLLKQLEETGSVQLGRNKITLL